MKWYFLSITPVSIVIIIHMTKSAMDNYYIIHGSWRIYIFHFSLLGFIQSTAKAMISVRPKGLTFVETQCKNIQQVKLPYSVIKAENTVTVFFLFALIRAKQVHVIKTNPRIGLPRTWIFYYNFCWFHFHSYMWNKQFEKGVFVWLVGFNVLGLIDLSSASLRLATVCSGSKKSSCWDVLITRPFL